MVEEVRMISVSVAGVQEPPPVEEELILDQHLASNLSVQDPSKPLTHVLGAYHLHDAASFLVLVLVLVVADHQNRNRNWNPNPNPKNRIPNQIAPLSPAGLVITWFSC